MNSYFKLDQLQINQLKYCQKIEYLKVLCSQDVFEDLMGLLIQKKLTAAQHVIFICSAFKSYFCYKIYRGKKFVTDLDSHANK